MKLNKSLITLAVLVTVLATSCSQARYGNLTRRTKATHLTQQKPEKKNEVKSEVAITQTPVTTKNNEVILKQNVEPSIERTKDEVVFTTRKVNKHDVLARFNEDYETVKNEDKINAVKEITQSLPAIVIKQATKELQKIGDKAESNKTQGLVKLLIIIILVLLILALLPPLGGLIRGLISLLILILLIWLLLQIL